MKWFRLYDDILDDPKMSKFTDVEFVVWIKLLAYVNRHFRPEKSGVNPVIPADFLKHAARYPMKPVSLEFGEKLSVRELEILRLTACGMSNKDIASALSINIRTVKAHLGEIFSKMGVASRTEAVITGLRTEILSLDDLQ